MIERHYGRLARDGREHAVALLDALALERAVDATWTSNRSRANALSNSNTRPPRRLARRAWTLGGRRGSLSSPPPTTKELISRNFSKPSDGLASIPCGVNAGGVGRGLGPRASGRAAGPTGGGGCARISRLGGGLEGDCVAECFELFDEAAGAVFGGVAAGEPVGAEFAVGDAVGDDVVVGDQDVVVGGAGCFRVAAAAADLPVVGGEVGVLAAGGGVGGLGERGAQPGVAVASFAGAASVAGLVGVGADRGPGDEPLGAAENAHVEAALGDQHLGDVAFHARDGGEQVDQLGVGGGSDAGVERGNCLVERVDVGEQAGDEPR